MRRAIGGSIVAVGVLALGPAVSSGALLVYEPFDYDTELTHLDGVEATGQGLSGNWSQRHTGEGESNIVPGLSFGPLVTSGNAFQMSDRLPPASGDRYNVASATIGATTTESTIWHSHLVQFEVHDEEAENNSENPNSRWQSRVSVHDGQHSRTDAPAQFGFSATRDGSTSEGRIQMAGTTDGGEALDFGVPYLVVAKLTGLHDDGEDVTKTADMWVLSLDDYLEVVAAGFDETALDDNNQFTISRSVTNDDEIGLMGELNIHTIDWTEQNFFPIYDEIRFATTLQSAIIPEPASLALLGAGGLLLLRRRRA